MNGAGTVGPQAGIVLRRGIAFVLVKAVGWICLSIGKHQSVSRDFGQHRGCSNRNTTRITTYDKTLRNRGGQGRYAVDEQHVRDAMQLTHSTEHRLFGSPQDVMLIDLRVRDNANAIG